MAYSLTVQGNNGASASGTSITQGFTVGADDKAIIVWVAFTGVITSVSLSDGTHTYTTTSTQTSVASTLTHWVNAYYVLNPTPGSYTLTVTLGGSRANRRVAVATLTQIGAYQTAAAQGQLAAATTTDAVSTSSMTPSAQPAALAAISLTASGTATYSAGTGFTSAGALANWDAIGSFSSLLEHIRLTSTSAVAGTFTIDTSRDALSSGLILTEAPHGTFASTLDGATMAASGHVPVTGEIAATLAGATAAMSGTVVVIGGSARRLFIGIGIGL